MRKSKLKYRTADEIMAERYKRSGRAERLPKLADLTSENSGMSIVFAYSEQKPSENINVKSTFVITAAVAESITVFRYEYDILFVGIKKITMIPE